MPPPGYVFRDGGTTPPGEETSDKRLGHVEPAKPVTATPKAPLGQKTTTSHQLATENHEIQGAAQRAGKEDTTTNLGWQANAVNVETFVGRLPNEELWTLVRRFNKQMYHVKAIPESPPGGLDLNIAEEDEFSPDKLRSTLERLYMTVIVGLIAFGKHIARLRSWREPRRTAGFAAVYFLAWIFDLIMPTLFTFIIVLITVPEARTFLFPPAPLALVDHKTGGVQKPKAGVLGSHDSVTGAPEKHQGEAVEQEASNLVSGIASVAISSAAGQHDQANPDEKGGSKTLDASAPDPTKMATAAADASASAQGDTPHPAHDKTKQPMEETVWKQMRPVMHAINDVSDMWERFANALSPTPPFSHKKRYQLGAIFVPLLLISLVTRAEWVIKGTTFFGGFAFFSDPLMQRGIRLLNEKIPDWPKYLELRNTLLKGVPTNAQLTLTLLRIGEANRAPLPPPPTSNEPPPEKPAEVDKKALTDNGLDASHGEIEDAITVDKPPAGQPQTPAQAQEQVQAKAAEQEAQKKKKGGIGSKIMSAFKTTTAGGVETKLTVDSVKASLGSQSAKEKLGVLPTKDEMKAKQVEGPVEYRGRYNGRKGAVYIDSSVSPPSGNRPASPCVYFTTHLDGHESVETMPHDPDWAISIADLAEVKKIGGLGWKGKIVVGWATNREVKDGIELVTRDGRRYHVMAIKDRDALFNRLISMGQQVWESY
ncbi:hypothetical protein HRR83_004452 [Exophiala dermatitidis]|nr:hypothetical protein HRR74_004268 [Exophiala dermatitidis]KAJ4529342.1 hypothetical protein HRR73_000365 [Exophiala dermatitidis]KAJ4544004.1 hypothetical protein HRR76_002079 [Exophiala dermatitidis]KAJ4575469.1 hypothetical protein HRR79_002390 [Exophiala dermatitidis]KAJ4582718.1 hypothetical protein HRR81_001447 [Exophiala dermatitidis]